MGQDHEFFWEDCAVLCAAHAQARLGPGRGPRGRAQVAGPVGTPPLPAATAPLLEVQGCLAVVLVCVRGRSCCAPACCQEAYGAVVELGKPAAPSQ